MGDGRGMAAVSGVPQTDIADRRDDLRGHYGDGLLRLPRRIASRSRFGLGPGSPGVMARPRRRLIAS
jgi:hypothetical protein